MANPIFHSQYTAQQIEDLITNGAPIVGQNGHWWRWNVSAQQYEDTGVTADSETAAEAAAAAKAAAELAQGKAEDAQGKAEDAQDAAETAQGKAEEAAQEAEETLNSKADVDGDYPDMTVGTARQLVGSSGVSDRVPYTFRRTGGGVSAGNRAEVKSVVGGTVGWNQLCASESVTVQSGHKYLLKKGTAWSIGASTGTAITGLTSGSDMVIDLTLMFGKSIADYLNSLETATAGAGVAKLSEWGYDLDNYHATNAGTLESVKTSAHITRDAEDNVLGEYPLAPIELRGIPKLDSNNALYYDGDTYAPDGSITRKFGVVDLGSLNWTRNTANQFYASLTIAGMQYTENQICIKYQASARGAYDGNVDKAITVTGLNCWIRDTSYDTAADLKPSLSDVYLVYELATPTTETAAPYQSMQIVSADGTEAYTDAAVEAGDRDIAIPVGHTTFYFADLAGAIERVMVQVPPPPSGNGNYRLTATVTSGGVTYSWEALS